uniref:hypothetical protein n=1 Tax=Marinobacterium profundum TaxID=1714300 RepID=UPI0008294EFB|nr:hypothetical protein [Marinobacterium profundum]
MGKYSVLNTDGARNIGQSIAFQLHGEGYRVIAADTVAPEATELTDDHLLDLSDGIRSRNCLTTTVSCAPPDYERALHIIDNTLMQRMVEIDDVAHSVRFFLDARSGYVTGQALYACEDMTVGLASI